METDVSPESPRSLSTRSQESESKTTSASNAQAPISVRASSPLFTQPALAPSRSPFPDSRMTHLEQALAMSLAIEAEVIRQREEEMEEINEQIKMREAKDAPESEVKNPTTAPATVCAAVVASRPPRYPPSHACRTWLSGGGGCRLGGGGFSTRRW